MRPHEEGRRGTNSGLFTTTHSAQTGPDPTWAQSSGQNAGLVDRLLTASLGEPEEEERGGGEHRILHFNDLSFSLRCGTDLFSTTRVRPYTQDFQVGGEGKGGDVRGTKT